MIKVEIFLIFFTCISPSWQIHNDSLLVSISTHIQKFDPVTRTTQLVYNASATEGYIANIEYDIHHNCIFYAMQTKSETNILEKCLGDNRTERIIADAVALDTGMSYDWSAQLLYFLSSRKQYTDSIEVIKIVRNHNYSDTNKIRMNYMRRTIVTTPKLKCFLCDIAVHPVKKLLFWTSGHLGYPAIRRANADGTNVRKIVGKEFTTQPIEIAIDLDFDKIYWVDSRRHVIGRSDFDGNNVKLFDLPDPHLQRTTTALVVTKDTIYWNIEHSKEVYYGSKDLNHKTITRVTLGKHKVSASPLRLASMNNRTQVPLTPSNCSHLCIHSDDGSFKCLCPNGMKATPAGNCVCEFTDLPSPDGICAEKFNHYNFRCADGIMIDINDVCNNFSDCSDNTDENGCLNWKCDPSEFQCKSDGKCLEGSEKCDGRASCPDGSDESQCVSCGEDNNTTGKRCDGIYDCTSKVDEQNCGEGHIEMIENAARTTTESSEET